MNIDILISTLNNGIYNISNILLLPKNSITYIIGHQVTNQQSYNKIYEVLKKRGDVKLIITHQRGLSKNRNTTLAYARSDIIVICDDDAELVNNIDACILTAFEKHNKADIITFRIKGMQKNYSRDSYEHTISTLSSVSSIEIAMKRESIFQKKVIFDESFGLGSNYPIGEEFIFLVDAYRKDLKIFYEPKIIAKHEELSSGWKGEKEILIARGAVFARIFGVFSFIINIYSAIKSRRYTPPPYPFMYGLKNMFYGSYKYFKEKRCI